MAVKRAPDFEMVEAPFKTVSERTKTVAPNFASFHKIMMPPSRVNASPRMGLLCDNALHKISCIHGGRGPIRRPSYKSQPSDQKHTPESQLAAVSLSVYSDDETHLEPAVSLPRYDVATRCRTIPTLSTTRRNGGDGMEAVSMFKGPYAWQACRATHIPSQSPAGYNSVFRSTLTFAKDNTPL